MDSQNSNTMRLSDDGSLRAVSRTMAHHLGRAPSIAFGLLRACRTRAGQSLR
jgi:hypothetical protein